MEAVAGNSRQASSHGEDRLLLLHLLYRVWWATATAMAQWPANRAMSFAATSPLKFNSCEVTTSEGFLLSPITLGKPPPPRWDLPHRIAFV